MTKCLDHQQEKCAVDSLAAALANPKRVACIERLCRGPATTSELAAETAAALPTMQQHLDKLREAGLITSTKHGRTVTHHANLAPLSALEDWIATRRAFWTKQLDALADTLERHHGH